MADDNAKLLIVLEAQSKKLQNQLADATRTIDRFAAQTNRRFDAMNNKNAASFERLNKRVGTSMGALSGIIGRAFAGAAALRGAQALIDSATRIENSLKVAGLSGEKLTEVYDALFDSAQRNAAPVEALVDLYGRASLVQKELGVSTEELLGFTDKVAVALRVSGKSAAESSGALLQLSQALGGGVVRAEEFNSILEGALPIAQAAAAGLEEAGGSVAKLRQLVVDGKVSSEAFFRAFEAGSSILTDKVAGAELTVSQGFIRLQNVLIDAAGKFDTATGASSRTAAGLDYLAGRIEMLGQFFAANAGTIGTVVDKLIAFNEVVKLIPGFDIAGDIETGFKLVKDGAEAATDAIESMGDGVEETAQSQKLALQDSLLALEDWRAGWGTTLPPELAASVETLIAKLIAGGEEAALVEAALVGLGSVNPSFSEALASLGNLAGELQRVRGEAAATATAVSAASVAGTPQTFAGQEGTGAPKPAVKPVSLTDYVIPPGGGGSKQSPGEKFGDALERQAEENRLLQEKTALQSTLNPLVNDYGYAIERLAVQQELQTAATAAGLELTPELKAKIEELATGYASASVEAAKLAESQDQLADIASDFGDAGKSAIKGFISDLREGKSAADALGNAMNSILDKVIDIGLNLLLGGLGGGGGGIGALFGFAGGGYTGNGGKNQPAGVVHKGEYVFTKAQTERLGVGNLARLARGYANGGYVGAPGPVSGKQANDNGALTVQIELDNELLNARVVNTAGRVVATAAPTIVQTAVDRAPSATAEKQARFG